MIDKLMFQIIDRQTTVLSLVGFMTEIRTESISTTL